MDTLFVVRNAPGDSRWNLIERYVYDCKVIPFLNCIFRLWALINMKVCGLVLPAKTDDQTEDEFEDAAINQLIEEALGDLEYNGHPVFSVPVPCNSSEVVIEGKVRNTLKFKISCIWYLLKLDIRSLTMRLSHRRRLAQCKKSCLLNQ